MPTILRDPKAKESPNTDAFTRAEIPRAASRTRCSPGGLADLLRQNGRVIRHAHLKMRRWRVSLIYGGEGTATNKPWMSELSRLMQYTDLQPRIRFRTMHETVTISAQRHDVGANVLPAM